MRVLTVAACPFPTRQGSQLLIRQCAEALASRGHEVRIFAYGGEEPTPCAVPIVRAPRLPGAGRLRAGPSLAKPLLDAALALTVARHRGRFRPDVIHAHNLEGAAVGLAAAGGLPVVYHAHGLIEAELPSYLSPGIGGFAARVGAAADRLLPSRSAGTIVLTQAARESLLRLGADPARLHVVPPGIAVRSVDPARARRLRTRLCGEGEALVLYAGNADAYQGLETLLDAARLLKSGLVGGPGPWERDRPARFVFALPGGARRLPREAAARGLSDRVTFLDASWDETAQLLVACDAAVVPRADPHGFPMKLLNALALGAPVIVHAASAHGLTDGVQAIVVRDADNLAAGLARALGDPGWARRIGEAGRLYARKHHAWEDIAPRIESVLAKAAGAG